MTKSMLKIAKETDRRMGTLLGIEWVVGVLFACYVSPKTWAGAISQTHIHIYAALGIGGLLATYPNYLVWKQPGARLNGYVITASQMLFSILLIHLTGGRIETHFHIFGSIAFIAFYRNWRLVIFATSITAADHFLRGFFWPESVYGVVSATPWRAFEHAGWVIFEDVVLLFGIADGIRQLESMANRTVELEKSQLKYQLLVENLESQVKDRAQQSVQMAKMASLGEMSAGIAHEINNPLAIISGSAGLLLRFTNNPEKLASNIENIKKSCERISRIVTGLRKFSRSGDKANMKLQDICSLAKEVTILTEAKSKRHNTPVTVECDTHSSVFCDEVEIEQVLVNLVNNAIDAVKERKEKWVKISVYEEGQSIVLRVMDSGSGIPEHIQNKLFDPFFTTKKVGEGTGLGLSITKGILNEHNATISVVPGCPNTCFEIRFVKAGEIKNAA